MLTRLKMISGIAMFGLSLAAVSAPTYYNNSTTFDTANPGLALENFEGLTVGGGGTQTCGVGGYNSTTAGGCGPAGTVIAGFTFEAVSQGELAIGAGFNGNPSTYISTNFFTDFIRLTFAGGVHAIGFDLMSQFGDDPAMQIQLFSGATLLDTVSSPGTNAGSFWGVSDSANLIDRIEVFSTQGQAEGIDNLRFGDATAAPVPATLYLLGLGLAGLGFGRRKQA